AGEDFVPSATLYFGEGDGTFTESDADLTAVGDYANERSSTTMADVDGDGNQDLLILGTAGSATATLYLGDGDGDFTEANAGFAGVSNGSASVADVDGDGHRDVLIIGRDAGFSPSTTLYLGDGEGGFTEAGADLPAVENGMATIANVDEDEHPDVLLTGQDEDMVPTTKVYLGEGDGTFEDGEAGLEDMRESRMVVGDMDGDGDLDAVVSGETPFNEDRTRLYDNLAVDDDPVASASASISGSDTTSFGDTGLSISFADGTGSGTVSVSRFDDAPEAPDGIAEENVSNYRVVISSDPDFSVGDSTEVRFDASDFDGVENPDSVVVYSREGVGTGAFDPLPTAYDEGADELIATVEGFSEFAFASDSDPLPVELAGMEATTGEESVRIEWQTAAEENNAGFAVERRAGSGDESDWTELGFVKSAAEGGTTDRPQAYRFVDEDLPYEADRLAYRLRQVDADGTTETFAPVEVERGVQTLQLEKVVPTPASGQATVRLAVPEKQEVRVAVYDLLGRSVRTVAEGPMEGREEVTVDLGGLSSGTYFVRLTAEGEVQTRRLVVVQ
ncbi:MAG: T9SS type A sorting domain-containing protein, partial [Salinibacter sp.]